jgi:hypothetical protein
MRRLAPSLPVLVTAVALSGAAVLPLSAALAAPVAAQDTFIPGTGTSSASIARVTLRSSGLGIGVGLGQTRSRFAGAQGNAEADSVDLGLLNTLSKAPVACGYAVSQLFPEGSMPSGLVVSSGGGPAEQRTASVGQGTPVELGSQYAAAAPNSTGAATVDGAKIDLQGLVTAIGGTASSTAKLTPNKQRAASAESGMGSLTLAGGAVVLEGMHWTASHRTGAEADSAAGFTIGSMQINGQYYPTSGADLQTSLDQANTALAATGISLHAPQVTKSAGGISVSPLRLTLSTTKEMRQILGPALEAIQPIRSQLLTFVAPFGASPDCGLAKGLGFGYLVADLALVVLGDNGGIYFNIGGANAGPVFATYSNPFGSGYGLINILPGGLLPGTPATPDLGAAPGTGPLVPGALPQQPQTTTLLPTGGDLLPVALGCRSTHDDGGGCAAHRGVLAGWLIFALIVLLAGADRIRARMT